MDVLNRIGSCGIVPVVVIDKVDDAVKTADALYAGGVDVMEITLRTEAALESIREVSRNLKKTIIGAGTVITLDQCKAAVDMGAMFIVSPGLNRNVVEWCVKNNIAVTPGAVTPTEIIEALSFDLRVLKFFPANIYGGLPAIKALAGPFGNVKFIPTGSIDTKNLHEYAASPFIHALGGSWLCTRQDIQNGNFDVITSISAQSVEIVKTARG